MYITSLASVSVFNDDRFLARVRQTAKTDKLPFQETTYNSKVEEDAPAPDDWATRRSVVYVADVFAFC